MALNTEARAKGFQAMRKSLTAAQRVRQRLNAGRSPSLPASLAILDAVVRLSNEVERARKAMREERLEPEDIHLGLLFSISTPSEDGLQEYIGVQWWGARGNVGAFIAELEKKMAGPSTIQFLGVISALLDREANRGIMWAKPIVSGPGVEEKLQMAKGLFKSPHRIN
jgi:hypothetical protein